MKVSRSQSLKAMRGADVPWDVNLMDPRSARGVRHAHRGLLNVLLVGFACGKRTLRGAEETVEDLSAGARRRLGIPKSVSDSCLYRLLEKQGVDGFRETLQNQFDELWAAGVVSNDFFPFGVVSVDGKGTWSSTDTAVEEAKESSCDAQGKPLWFLGTLRAVLTSSRVVPCMDMELIAAKDAESPTFRRMAPRLCQQFGQRFRLFTGDAGLTCRENAALVRELGKDYCFALKGNQPSLNALAQSRLSAAPAELRLEQKGNGRHILRELVRVPLEATEERLGFIDARQLWRVRQTSFKANTPPVLEDRYFVTSLGWKELEPAHILALVRLHWGIENGHNWTMDAILGEDDSQPCQRGRDSIEVIAWLRILAYNLVAAWRARAKPKDKRPMPWRRVIEMLRDALVHGSAPGALAAIA